MQRFILSVKLKVNSFNFLSQLRLEDAQSLCWEAYHYHPFAYLHSLDSSFVKICNRVGSSFFCKNLLLFLSSTVTE